MEKLKKIRGREFYIAVLDKFKNEKGGISTSTELKETFREVSKSQGYTLEKSSESWILAQFERMLTDKWLGKEKIKKRAGGYMYTLKFITGSEESCYKSVKECIDNYFNNRYSGKGKKKEKDIESMVIKPHKSVFIKVYSILKWMTENNTDKIFRAKLLEIVGLSAFSDINLQGWINNLAKGGISFDATYVSGGIRNTFLRVRNVEGTLASFVMTSKKLFPEMNLSLPSFGRLKGYSPEKVICTEKYFITEEPEELARFFFGLGSIINEFDDKAGIDDICKNLDTKFNIKESKIGVLGKIKGSDYFESIRNGLMVKFKDPNSWRKVCELYGPQNFKKEVIARLTLPIDEIKQYFKEVEMISEIVPGKDAIYRIHYDGSVHSLKKFILLVRRFRDPDKIFNDELVEKIRGLVKISDDQMFVNSLEYQSEREIFAD